MREKNYFVKVLLYHRGVVSKGICLLSILSIACKRSPLAPGSFINHPPYIIKICHVYGRVGYSILNPPYRGAGGGRTPYAIIS
jgi:hypothetical protein